MSTIYTVPSCAIAPGYSVMDREVGEPWLWARTVRLHVLALCPTTYVL